MSFQLNWTSASNIRISLRRLYIFWLSKCILYHQKLLIEFNEIGICGVFFDVIENNYIDCKQYVIFNDGEWDQ